VEQLMAQRNVLDAQAQALQSKNDDLEDQIRSLQSEIRQLKAKSEVARQTFEEEMKATRRKMTLLETDLGQKREEVERIKESTSRPVSAGSSSSQESESARLVRAMEKHLKRRVEAHELKSFVKAADEQRHLKEKVEYLEGLLSSMSRGGSVAPENFSEDVRAKSPGTECVLQRDSTASYFAPTYRLQQRDDSPFVVAEEGKSQLTAETPAEWNINSPIQSIPLPALSPSVDLSRGPDVEETPTSTPFFDEAACRDCAAPEDFGAEEPLSTSPAFVDDPRGQPPPRTDHRHVTEHDFDFLEEAKQRRAAASQRLAETTSEVSAALEKLQAFPALENFEDRLRRTIDATTRSYEHQMGIARREFDKKESELKGQLESLSHTHQKELDDCRAEALKKDRVIDGLRRELRQLQLKVGASTSDLDIQYKRMTSVYASILNRKDDLCCACHAAIAKDFANLQYNIIQMASTMQIMPVTMAPRTPRKTSPAPRGLKVAAKMDFSPLFQLPTTRLVS
jgi:hypothetical protein